MYTTYLIPLGAFAIIHASSAVIPRAQGETIVNTKGNVHLAASPQMLSYGDQTPWSVLESISSNCMDGTCPTAPWTIPTTFTGGDDGTSVTGTLTITAVDASYPTWQRTAIVATLKTFSSQAYTVDHTFHMVGGSCQLATGTPCDPGTKDPIDQYYSSSMFYMAVDGTGSADEVRFSITSSVDPDQGVIPAAFCTDLTTVGSAIAGTMGEPGAIAGAGFTLLGLACGD